MLPSFEKCVAAIAETVLWQEAHSTRHADKVGNVTEFLLATHSNMPDYLRLAFRIATLAFDAWSYPFTGKPFHAMDIGRRGKQIEVWKSSRLQFRQGLIGFYRTLATFGLYSEIYNQDHAFGTSTQPD